MTNGTHAACCLQISITAHALLMARLWGLMVTAAVAAAAVLGSMPAAGHGAWLRSRPKYSLAEWEEIRRARPYAPDFALQQLVLHPQRNARAAEGCLNACSLHGVCVTGVCHCDRGWRGTMCHVPVCEPNCLHGACVAGKCECYSEPDEGIVYAGEACDQGAASACAPPRSECASHARPCLRSLPRECDHVAARRVFRSRIVRCRRVQLWDGVCWT